MRGRAARPKLPAPRAAIAGVLGVCIVSQATERSTAVALDGMGSLRRTHGCGELRATDVGREVVVAGWVHRRRDHGGVCFVDLRDRTGLVQAVFKPEVAAEAHRRAEDLRSEFVA